MKLTMVISFPVSKTYFMTFLSLPMRSAMATRNMGIKLSGKKLAGRFVSTRTVGILHQATKWWHQLITRPTLSYLVLGTHVSQ